MLERNDQNKNKNKNNKSLNMSKVALLKLLKLQSRHPTAPTELPLSTYKHVSG